MWNIVYAALRSYAPVVTLPIAMVVGFIGYNAENIFSTKSTPHRELTVLEEREERKLRELEEGEKNDDSSQRYTTGIPKTVLDRNQFRKRFGEGSYEQKTE